MDILTYLKSLPTQQRKLFAFDCGVSLGHLQNVAYGYKTCDAALAVHIEEKSRGMVRVEHIRPDLPWHVIRKTRMKAA